MLTSYLEVSGRHDGNQFSSVWESSSSAFWLIAIVVQEVRDMWFSQGGDKVSRGGWRKASSGNSPSLHILKEADSRRAKEGLLRRPLGQRSQGVQDNLTSP